MQVTLVASNAGYTFGANTLKNPLNKTRSGRSWVQWARIRGYAPPSGPVGECQWPLISPPPGPLGPETALMSGLGLLASTSARQLTLRCHQVAQAPATMPVASYSSPIPGRALSHNRISASPSGTVAPPWPLPTPSPSPPPPHRSQAPVSGVFRVSSPPASPHVEPQVLRPLVYSLVPGSAPHHRLPPCNRLRVPVMSCTLAALALMLSTRPVSASTPM